MFSTWCEAAQTDRYLSWSSARRLEILSDFETKPTPRHCDVCHQSTVRAIRKQSADSFCTASSERPQALMMTQPFHDWPDSQMTTVTCMTYSVPLILTNTYFITAKLVSGKDNLLNLLKTIDPTLLAYVRLYSCITGAKFTKNKIKDYRIPKTCHSNAISWQFVRILRGG